MSLVLAEQSSGLAFFSAAKIQSIWRCHRTQIRLNKLSNRCLWFIGENGDRKKELTSALVSIQCAWRKIKACSTFKHKKHDTSTVKIQCKWRIKQAKSELKMRKKRKQEEEEFDQIVDKMHTNLRVFLFVLRIQSSWRCYQARGILQTGRSVKKKEEEHNRRNELLQSALYIQSWYRRFRCRAWFHTVDEALLRLQQYKENQGILHQYNTWENANYGHISYGYIDHTRNNATFNRWYE